MAHLVRRRIPRLSVARENKTMSTPQELDRKLQELDRKLLAIHREMRSAAHQFILASRPPGSYALVAVMANPDPAHPILMNIGDIHDLMIRLVDIRDSDPRKSQFAYVGIFDLEARKNREPRAMLDIMNTGDAWQVGEAEGR